MPDKRDEEANITSKPLRSNTKVTRAKKEQYSYTAKSSKVLDSCAAGCLVLFAIFLICASCFIRPENARDETGVYYGGVTFTYKVYRVDKNESKNAVK